MKPKTAYSIMFVISCALVGLIVKLPRILDWCVGVDGLAFLFVGSVILTFIGLIGINGHRDREKIDQIIHEEREEKVKWILKDVIERRKKELMQKQKVDVE